MTPRAVVSSVDEPPGRSDLGGRRTPQLQVRATAVPAEAGRGRRSESPQVTPTILTLPRPCEIACRLRLGQQQGAVVENLAKSCAQGVTLGHEGESLVLRSRVLQGPGARLRTTGCLQQPNDRASPIGANGARRSTCRGVRDQTG